MVLDSKLSLFGIYSLDCRYCEELTDNRIPVGTNFAKIFQNFRSTMEKMTLHRCIYYPW